MASARKKLDEKHLKILRELVSLPGNKHCFDCHQRGPTYVNVTIGCFVCTTCSGILRGLTPPHRVKSISMATFSPEEVELVRSRGNEYCRRVWLGLCDTDEPTKDEQQIKEFMIAKYEKKRYYIEPSDETKIAVNGTSNQSSPGPTIPPPSSLSIKPPTQVHKNSKNHLNNNNNNISLKFPPSKTLNVQSDPFNSPVSEKATPIETQPSFANFDNNPIFSADASTTSSGWDSLGDLRGLDMTSSMTSTVQQEQRWSSALPSDLKMWNPYLPSTALPSNRWSYSGGTLINAPPAEDRYAALKDLDSLMKTQMASEQTTNTNTSTNDWGNTGWAPASLFNSAQEQNSGTVNSSNPFTGQNGWNDMNSFVGNPFKPQRPQTETPWSVTNGQVTNGFPTSQSLNFGPAKVAWNPEAMSNPFAVGCSSQVKTTHHSSNPFL